MHEVFREKDTSDNKDRFSHVKVSSTNQTNMQLLYLGDHKLFRGRLHGDRFPGLVGHRRGFHGVIVIGVMVVIVMVNGVPVVVLLNDKICQSIT